MLSFVNRFGHDVLSQQWKIEAKVLTRENVTVVADMIPFFLNFILFCLFVGWIYRIVELLSSWVIKHRNKNWLAHSSNILKDNGAESYVEIGRQAQEVLEWLDLATWIETILVRFWQWMWLLFILVLRFYLWLNWKNIMD